jgi:hypothetical protein
LLDILRAMARLDPQVNFRLPEELRQKLQAAADEAKRTLTAEIVARLEGSFTGRSMPDPEFESVKLAFGYGFATASIHGLLSKIVDALGVQIPETTDQTIDVIGDAVGFFLDDLERSHKYAVEKAAANRSPVLKRPEASPTEPRKPGEPILKDPRRNR